MEGRKMLNDFPRLSDIKPEYEPGNYSGVTDIKGKVILIPIWKIALERGSHN
jgi:hypothetical protein